jgi:hypothetical protein
MSHLCGESEDLDFSAISDGFFCSLKKVSGNSIRKILFSAVFAHISGNVLENNECLTTLEHHSRLAGAGLTLPADQAVRGGLSMHFVRL